jgi:hypothetical protein
MRAACFRPPLGCCPESTMFNFEHFFGTRRWSRIFRRIAKRGSIVVSRNYFTRQVATLLKFAKTTSDPQIVTALVDKASELKSQADEAFPVVNPIGLTTEAESRNPSVP